MEILDFLVVALDQAEDALVGGVGLPLEVLHVAVGDIVTGDIVGADVHQLVLHHILDFFHADGAVQLLAAGGDGAGDLGDLLLRQPQLFVHRLVRLGDSHDDLGNIEWHFGAVALDDLHGFPPLSLYIREWPAEVRHAPQYCKSMIPSFSGKSIR